MPATHRWCPNYIATQPSVAYGRCLVVGINVLSVSFNTNTDLSKNLEHVSNAQRQLVRVGWLVAEHRAAPALHATGPGDNDINVFITVQIIRFQAW